MLGILSTDIGVMVDDKSRTYKKGSFIMYKHAEPVQGFNSAINYGVFPCLIKCPDTDKIDKLDIFGCF